VCVSECACVRMCVSFCGLSRAQRDSFTYACMHTYGIFTYTYANSTHKKEPYICILAYVKEPYIHKHVNIQEPYMHINSNVK